jgi:hypothetical protein
MARKWGNSMNTYIDEPSVSTEQDYENWAWMETIVERQKRKRKAVTSPKTRWQETKDLIFIICCVAVTLYSCAQMLSH